MTYASLLESVEESAHERERELKERAERSIRDIRKDAQEQADLFVKKHMEHAVKEAAAGWNRAHYLANARNKQDVILVKKDLFNRSFTLAGQELTNIRSDPAYPEIFSALLEEAVGSMKGQDVKIRIDRKDLALCKTMLEKLSIQADISPDITTAGGLQVTNSNGDVVIANTIESRLERAMEILRLEIFSILDGG